MSRRILIKRDTTSNWASNNPVLLEGELGLDTTLDKMKMGNGTSAWLDLPFITVADVSTLALASQLSGYSTTSHNHDSSYLASTALDTSTDLDGVSASDSKVPSQLAVKTYVDGYVTGAVSSNNVIKKMRTYFIPNSENTRRCLNVSNVGTINASYSNGDCFFVSQDASFHKKINIGRDYSVCGSYGSTYMAISSSSYSNTIYSMQQNGNYVSKTITNTTYSGTKSCGVISKNYIFFGAPFNNMGAEILTVANHSLSIMNRYEVGISGVSNLSTAMTVDSENDILYFIGGRNIYYFKPSNNTWKQYEIPMSFSSSLDYTTITKIGNNIYASAYGSSNTATYFVKLPLDFSSCTIRYVNVDVSILSISELADGNILFTGQGGSSYIVSSDFASVLRIPLFRATNPFCSSSENGTLLAYSTSKSHITQTENKLFLPFSLHSEDSATPIYSLNPINYSTQALNFASVSVSESSGSATDVAVAYSNLDGSGFLIPIV